MDLVLRNNQTSALHPDGIFHPHQNLHHIKKENIGLIEVMGLAVLPARLKDEMALLKECLLGNNQIEDVACLQKHHVWMEELKKERPSKENIDLFLAQALCQKFVEVLEDAGVFKMNQKGIDALIAFTKSLDKEGNE